MKLLLPAIAAAVSFGCGFSEAFAALSKEPVIITNCRSFAARADSESKTGLASRFADCLETDCDDINKVSANKILSLSGTLDGRDGVFELRAFYPDGQSYDHYILMKSFRNPSRDTEIWMASSPDFARSTYAVARSDLDKARPMGIFAESSVAPSVVPAILYSFGRDHFLDDADKSVRRNYDLGLIRIYESIVGGSAGFTSEFVQSEDWFDAGKRTAALKTLRDYTIASIPNIKVDNSLDPQGRLFSDYMKIYSDEFAEMARREAELEGKKLELGKTFALDDSAYWVARKAALKQSEAAASASGCSCGGERIARMACSDMVSGSCVESSVVSDTVCECSCAVCDLDTCAQKREEPRRHRMKRLPRRGSYYVN